MSIFIYNESRAKTQKPPAGIAVPWRLYWGSFKSTDIIMPTLLKVDQAV